jgi:hypothetical protein
MAKQLNRDAVQETRHFWSRWKSRVNGGRAALDSFLDSATVHSGARYTGKRPNSPNRARATYYLRNDAFWGTEIIAEQEGTDLVLTTVIHNKSEYARRARAERAAQAVRDTGWEPSSKWDELMERQRG